MGCRLSAQVMDDVPEMVLSPVHPVVGSELQVEQIASLATDRKTIRNDIKVTFNEIQLEEQKESPNYEKLTFLYRELTRRFIRADQLGKNLVNAMRAFTTSDQ